MTLIADMDERMLENLTPDDFRPYVNTRFHITVAEADGTLAVELIEVSDLGQGGSGPRSQPFSLVFRGPRGLFLSQQIYTVNHDEMGPLDIFLVPIRPDEKGMQLQAIFN